jgi:hypothetical protein
MQMQVGTNVGWFSLFQWEPSRFSFRFSERESEFSHTEMTCPSVFSHWKPTFWKPLKVSVESLVEVGLKAQNAIKVFRAPHGINFNTLLLHNFPVINDRYLLGITGNVFLKITCVKESGVGFMPMQRRHLNSLEL